MNLNGTRVRGCRGASNYRSYFHTETQAALDIITKRGPEMLSVVGEALGPMYKFRRGQ